jgi:hypothetical protein
MSKALKTMFLVHALVSLLCGAPLLIVPGQMLTLLGWTPIDPLVSRVLGAALLALAWSSFRGWMAAERTRVAIQLEMETVFAVLACVGLLRHLLFGRWPLVPWLASALFLASALAWICFLVRRDKPGEDATR